MHWATELMSTNISLRSPAPIFNSNAHDSQEHLRVKEGENLPTSGDDYATEVSS